MLTEETLYGLVMAVATGYHDRALNLVLTAEDFSEEDRATLSDILYADVRPHERLERIGDALRESGAAPHLVNECYRAAFYTSTAWEALLDDPLFGYAMADRSGAVLDKWPHYFPVYSRHLSHFRRQPVSLLEIGVYRGGGLDMWKWYLGPSASLVGIDIDEVVLRSVGRRHTVLLGDQSDPQFLRRVNEEYGPFDIVIDDGGHTMEQQITSAETLFPLLNDGGVYLVEDCHTSYWPEYGGGLGVPGTFTGWAKDRIDDIHGYHVRDGGGHVDEVWTRRVAGLHVYDSVVVLEKEIRPAPFSQQTGSLDVLSLSRTASDVQSELLATRDAALAQRDEALQALELASPPQEQELRLARSEIGSLRMQVADLQEEVDRCHADLHSSWEHLRKLRGTISWRTLAPIRRLRSRMTRP